MYKIAVLDYRLHSDIKEQIQELVSNKIVFPTERCPENEWITRTGNADIALVTVWGKVDKEYLDSCPNLKYIGLCGTSTANIDLEELRRRGIAFSNIVSGDKESVAEYCFMQLVSLMRGEGKYQWKSGEEHELVGRSIGIIGLGQVGKAMAHMSLAYKMRANYFSPHRKSDLEDKGLTYLELDNLLEQSEIVAICSPTNAEILNEEKFNMMKPDAILIQASSGSPFSRSTFSKWMTENDANYAIVDMAAGEANYLAYKNLPRVIFSRKVAGDTYESDERRGKRAIENLKSFLSRRTT